MRDLTPEEIVTRDSRRKGLRTFLGAIPPTLDQFTRSIVKTNPSEYMHPEKFLPVLENWLRDEDLSKLSPNDRIWLQVRLLYVIGELMRHRYDAVWIVDEDPSSKFFLRYVLGYFKGDVKSDLVIDPGSVAEAYLDTPAPRSLISLLESIEDLQHATRKVI